MIEHAGHDLPEAFPELVAQYINDFVVTQEESVQTDNVVGL
jgi:hypothetical protein